MFVIRSSSVVMPRGFVATVFAVAALLAGCEKDLVPSFQEARPSWTNTHDPLLRTNWGQDGPYAALSPNHADLGCWSVAFAQVLAYHHLLPRGVVSYSTRNGTKINEKLNRTISWDHLVPSIDSLTREEDSVQTVLYCYQSAVVVQKDFGRGEYMDISAAPREVSDHYGCKVTRIDSGLRERIKREVFADRPVIAYFDDILDIDIVRNGHAAVIDGYAEEGERAFVHLNVGWKGAADGWYEFSGLAHDRDLRYIFAEVLNMRSRLKSHKM